MYKVCLINMPFAEINMPSLALTQLKSVINNRFGQEVSVNIYYLNLDFVHYIGGKLYRYIADPPEERVMFSGIGDWFFRQVAFPQLYDNSREYFRRFYPHEDEKSIIFKKIIQNKRQGLDSFLDRLIDKHKLAQADIVGFPSMFFQNVASFAMARKLKERKNDIITVMGGANCDSPMGQEIVKYVKYIDFVFSGPSLKSFPEFIQYCLDGEMEKCNSINGIFSKTNCSLSSNQSIKENERSIRLIGEDLDINTELELDYNGFLEAIDRTFPEKQISPSLLFETSRGCWWGERSKCAFCGCNGLLDKYREMTPKKATKQFTSLFKYASQCSNFFAVDRLIPKAYFEKVFPSLKVPPHVTLFYHTRTDLSVKEIEILSKTANIVVQPGIESLSTYTLKMMKKGATAFHNIRFLMNCLMFNIQLRWNLLVGFPGEDEEVYKKYIQNIPLLVHLSPPRVVARLRFPRYSPCYEQATHYGLDLQPLECYELIYPFENKVLENLAIWFSDYNKNAEYIHHREKWIGKIKDKCDYWNVRWSGKDQLPPAKLFLKKQGKSTVIYDSRTGTVHEHEISNVGKQILDYLRKPTTMSDLALNLDHLSNKALYKELAYLQKLGLLFRETERFMSLVLANENNEKIKKYA